MAILRRFKTDAIPALSFRVIAKTISGFVLRPFTNRDYPRTYMNADGHDSVGLKAAARRRVFFLGMASDKAESSDFAQRLSESFSFVTPENALKWGVLRNRLSEPYDLSRLTRSSIKRRIWERGSGDIPSFGGNFRATDSSAIWRSASMRLRI